VKVLRNYTYILFAALTALALLALVNCGSLRLEGPATNPALTPPAADTAVGFGQ